MLQGYCGECLRKIDITDKKDLKTCPLCGKPLTYLDAASNYIRLFGKDKTSSVDFIGDLNTDMKSTEDEIADLQKRLNIYINVLNSQKAMKAAVEKEIEGPSKYRDLEKGERTTLISVKLPQNMYDLAKDTIRWYYDGSLNKYVQSLIAVDIAKNREFYERYYESLPEKEKKGNSKRRDLIVKEKFYDMVSEDIDRSIGDPKSIGERAILLYKFNMYIREKRFTVKINGKEYIQQDPYELMNDIQRELKDYTELMKEQFPNGNYPGMPTELIYYPENDEPQEIVRNIVSRDNREYIRNTVGKKVGLYENLFTLFMGKQFSNMMLRQDTAKEHTEQNDLDWIRGSLDLHHRSMLGLD